MYFVRPAVVPEETAYSEQSPGQRTSGSPRFMRSTAGEIVSYVDRCTLRWKWS